MAAGMMMMKGVLLTLMLMATSVSTVSSFAPVHSVAGLRQKQNHDPIGRRTLELASERMTWPSKQQQQQHHHQHHQPHQPPQTPTPPPPLDLNPQEDSTYYTADVPTLPLSSQQRITLSRYLDNLVKEQPEVRNAIQR